MVRASITHELLAVNSVCYRVTMVQALVDINVSQENRDTSGMDEEQLLIIHWSGEAVGHRCANGATEQVTELTTTVLLPVTPTSPGVTDMQVLLL